MILVLKGGLLFDGTGRDTVENGVLIINDQGAIEFIGDRSDVELPVGHNVLTYDLKGKFILPGLIDAHIHLDLHGLPDTFQESLVEDKLRTIRAAKDMENTLIAGFTTVRNCGSTNCIDISVKNAIEVGWVNGPRILTSGKILSITCSGTEYFPGLYRVADGYTEFKKAAREQLAMGVDLVKIMATGAYMNPGGIPGAEQPDIKEIQAAVEEANKLGKKVAAHAHGTQGIKNAIQAGVSTIEHGTFADEEALSMMAERGVFLVPTLPVGYFMMKYGTEGGVPSFMLEKESDLDPQEIKDFRHAINAGVKLAMGTDAGTPYNYHGTNAYGIILLVTEGGLTAKEALLTATKNAAEALGIGSLLGTLERGKKADVIVVDGNPLENIEILSNVDNIRMVIKEGKVVKNLGNQLF